MCNEVNTTKNQVNSAKMDMSTIGGFEALQRAAKMFAASTLVPKDYQGSVGFSNCVIALNMASRLNADPIMVMQNLYIVHGRPGWSSKFLIATFNQSGKYSAIRFEFVGKEGTDDWGCRAVTIENATKEKIQGPLITIAMAKSEGWFSKSGSKWQTMPEQMLRYRSAAWLINTCAPEIAMGLPTSEEQSDTHPPVTEPSELQIQPVDPSAPVIQSEIVEEPMTSPQRQSRADALKSKLPGLGA